MTEKIQGKTVVRWLNRTYAVRAAKAKVKWH